jgi:hypothetical protein
MSVTSKKGAKGVGVVQAIGKSDLCRQPLG